MNKKKAAQVDHRLISIIDEMLTFFYSLRVENLKMDMNIEDDYTELCFRAKIKEPVEPKRLSKIKKLLGSPRAHEMEEYYWALTGNDMTPSTELSLVGMMIDEFSIEYIDGTDDFFIKIKRNNTRMR